MTAMAGMAGLALDDLAAIGAFFMVGVTVFGYRLRAGSTSPIRRRNGSQHYSPDYDRADTLPRSRGFGRGRDAGRFREYSPPPYGRGRFGGGRFAGRGFGGPAMAPSFRGEVIPRNNPNVRPREGDWMCTDPTCNNLNFARREFCNNCNRSRFAPPGSPRRAAYPGPPLMPRRFPGPPLDRSPGRPFNGYRSPPRGFLRDAPRDFVPPPHSSRHEGRFLGDNHRPDYFEEDLRDRSRFDRPMPPPLDWGRERKGYDRRPLSPVVPVGRGGGRWGREERERSRSPFRGGAAPPKDYRREGRRDPY